MLKVMMRYSKYSKMTNKFLGYDVCSAESGADNFRFIDLREMCINTKTFLTTRDIIYAIRATYFGVPFSSTKGLHIVDTAIGETVGMYRGAGAKLEPDLYEPWEYQLLNGVGMRIRTVPIINMVYNGSNLEYSDILVMDCSLECVRETYYETLNFINNIEVKIQNGEIVSMADLARYTVSSEAYHLFSHFKDRINGCLSAKLMLDTFILDNGMYGLGTFWVDNINGEQVVRPVDFNDDCISDSDYAILLALTSVLHSDIKFGVILLDVKGLTTAVVNLLIDIITSSSKNIIMVYDSSI